MIRKEKSILDYSLIISSVLLIAVTIIQWNIKNEGYELISPLNWLYMVIIGCIIMFGVVGVIVRKDNKLITFFGPFYLGINMVFSEIYSQYIILVAISLVAAILLSTKSTYNKIIRVIAMIASISYIIIVLLFSVSSFAFKLTQDTNIVAQYYTPSADKIVTIVVYDEEITSVYFNKVLEDKSLGIFGDLKVKDYGKLVGESQGVVIPEIVFDVDENLIIQWPNTE